MRQGDRQIQHTLWALGFPVVNQIARLTQLLYSIPYVIANFEKLTEPCHFQVDVGFPSRGMIRQSLEL